KGLNYRHARTGCSITLVSLFRRAGKASLAPWAKGVGGWTLLTEVDSLALRLYLGSALRVSSIGGSECRELWESTWEPPTPSSTARSGLRRRSPPRSWPSCGVTRRHTWATRSRRR